MRFRRLAEAMLIAMALGGLSYSPAFGGEPRKIRIGYFEGGAYPYHSRLRDEFQKQLNAILPDSIEANFAPDGFRSAEWDRSKSAVMAKELAGVKNLDLLLAIGPWVVNDLLAAGYKKPIVAMHQFAPQFEGLVESSGKPKAENLTIHIQPDKIKRDLTRLSGLVNVKKLGFLYFPSSNEADSVLAQVKAVGAELGFEVVTASGYDNKGRFAFYNAYNALDKKIDALYLPPLWGLDIQMINQFFYLADVARLPVMTSEDKFLVERGALLSNNANEIFSEARFSAYKAARVIMGDKPSQLPTNFVGGTSLAINEKTAQKCRVQLNRILYAEAEIITGAQTDESVPLTLSDAIARAVAFNPGMLAQKEAMNAAAAAASRAHSEYLPHLSAGAGFGHRDDNYVNNSRGELKQDYYIAQLNLRQRIFSMETIRSIQVAAREKEIENTNSEKVQQELERAVTKAYLSYLKAAEARDVVKRIRELLERNIEISGTKFLVENGSEYEYSRWRVERDKIIQAIIDAENNLKVAQILLNTLLNYPAEQNLHIPKDAFGMKAVSVTYNRLYEYFNNPARIDFIRQTLVERAVNNNPDIKRSRQQLALQQTLLSKNKSRYLPSLDLAANFRHGDELSDTPPPFKEEKDSWTIGGLITLPLFLGADRTREKRQLQAEYSRLEYRRDDVSLGIKSDVEISFQRLVSNLDKLALNIRRGERTKYNLELIVNGYDAGEFDMRYLLDEINEITTAEFSEISSRYGVYEEMADLAAALGWTAYGSGSTFTEMIEQVVMQN